MKYLAHISEDKTREQTVANHLEGTAKRAAAFAEPFGAEKQARIAAMLHDIGKYSAKFQQRIRGATFSVDHSTAGAQELFKKYHQVEAAFAVAGHHGGLPDGGNKRNDTSDMPTFFGRMRRNIPPYDAWQELEISVPRSTAPRYMDRQEESFYIRMLYSCLVDADYLDTEEFMNGAPRQGLEAQDLGALLEKVRAKANKWLSSANTSEVNTYRNKILSACIAAGQREKPGLFSLTVPTGGGKTFASLAFAMEHATAANKSRILYVIPYMSIIDQTAKNFKELLGEENVLAHYSGADYNVKDPETMTPLDYRKQHASENWNAPVIVTTAVQFFDSLYSNRPAKCRKLHNIANSVIIFDEAQTFPLPYLYPCVAAIANLVKDYGVSAVLCTATQPALDEMFAEYGLYARELAPMPEKLAADMRRFTLRQLGEVEQDNLAKQLTEHEQVLCVVNRRKTAQELYEKLPEKGRYCLTTLLCPKDRERLLDEIRAKLCNHEPCRVVSTSLIEAGVDVDFPTAYREESGLDSILQTGGRCNREGRHRAEDSLVYMFTLADQKALPALKQNINALHQAVRDNPDNLADLAAIKDYFQSLLQIKGDDALDQKHILELLSGKSGNLFPFETVSMAFSTIDTPSRTVYIPIEDGKELCEKLLNQEVDRTLLRRLGNYAVNVYPQEYDNMVALGIVTPVYTNGGVLTQMPHYYDKKTGLNIGEMKARALFS